jgi:hypothetical protein
VSTFIEMLKNESQDKIINHPDVNTSFNLFLNTFLIVYDSCFPTQYVTDNLSIIGSQQELIYPVSTKSFFTL